MGCVKELMKSHYLRYASYVILDRAIPDLADGLKPVQRRILHTLFKAHDGKFHKVANMVGQTMAYHPHGDAPIYEALVTLANKGYLLDCQGNFGNLFTGDGAAAARYIETRLSTLALEAMFNPDLTEYVPSYDGRNVEPVALPVKIPLLLMQGAEGIAVGMATKIFSHNFSELIKAQIAVLKGKKVTLYPDFHTGALMDVSEYDDGRGKIRLRCKIEEKNSKTLVIREICYSTTTESVIASIEEAAKKGKLKIDSIHDYTADKVEIEIALPRGVYASDVIEQLYAFTDCEVSLTSQVVVIDQDAPKEMSVSQIVEYYVERLKLFLRQEYELELRRIKQELFEKNLERIFIEYKLYKLLENVEAVEDINPVLQEAFKPYHDQLLRAPTKEDFELLLKIPIRRIAKFDRMRNMEACRLLLEREKETIRILGDIPKQAVLYLESMLKKYGSKHLRRTVIQDLEQIDRKEMERKAIEIGVDKETGYVGLKVPGGERLACTNFDRLLIILADGTYKVTSITDRAYVAKPNAHIVFCGIADKTQIFTCCYRDLETGLSFCKRFVVKQYVPDREYRYFDENNELLLLSLNSDSLFVQLVPKSRQRVCAFNINAADFPVKGVSARGIRLSRRPVLAVEAVTSSKR
jgi:topoisomerase IV subunit A